MPFWTYAYRIGREVALLDDDEWRPIGEYLSNRARRLKEYCETTGAALAEARLHEPNRQAAHDLYEVITGQRLDHPDQLFGVGMSDYGALCPTCDRPFRTPRATQ